MAYNIVKHRRGTTQEWLSTKIIPENGELIIEECIDGIRRCKIGDGQNLFTKLPYIDEAVQIKLLKEIDDFKQNVNTKVASAIKEISTLKETSARALDNTELKWANELENLRTSLVSADEALKTLLNSVADKEDTDFSELSYQLQSIRELINKLNKADITLLDKLYEFSSNADIASTQFSKELDKVKQQHNDSKANLVLELSRIEEAHMVANTGISDLFFDYISKVYAEIADLVDDDIIILKRLFVLEDKLSNKIDSYQSDIQTLYTEVDKLNDFTKEVADQFEDTAKKFTATDAELELQAKRISSIIALPDGSTTADAELTDIRKGHNGVVYTSAGDAVRTVGKEVASLRNSLASYIDTQAVDGLHYDLAGEVGLKRPYTLYLTAGNEVIEDSGVQIVSGSGGGGGGGTASSLKLTYITQSPLIVTPKDKAILRFIFSGTDSSGDTIKQASATWRINGVNAEFSTVRAGENEFDLTKHIKTGTTKVLLTVTDDNGIVVTKSWDIQQIDLTISSTFNDKYSYPADKPLVFDYTPSGAISKDIVFNLDGKIVDRVTLGKEISGTTVSYELPAQKHGSHLLDVYIEANINGEPVTSNHVLKDLLFYSATSSTPIIGVSEQDIKVKQYSTTNIIYTVYDPKNEKPKVSILVDGVVVAEPTVVSNKDYNDTPTAVYPYIATASGSHEIKIVCGNAEKVVKVYVEDIGINISPVTTGLAFDFNPAGRSNGDANRLWSHNNVHMTVSDDFDWVNGGYIPNDPDGPCFCIKAGSTATIDYKLFENEAKTSGKEVKIVFKAKNVSNPDTIFLSCIDNTTARDHVGFTMGAQSARIYGKSGNLELPYSEDDAVELEFNISKDSEAIPMVMGYEDGVPSRPMVYDSTYSFKQNTPKNITLGSPDCDLYIYRIKVYNTSLSAANILSNFIADARTPEEMLSRHNRNQIYDENQKLTAEVLAEKCPWLRVYKISAPHFTNNKSDKVKDTTIQQIYAGGDPILDNWIAHNAQHSGQGTSSNNYGAAGRNLDFIMDKSGCYFELGDGSNASTITLTRTSVPVAYLNAKVNIASSNNSTNAILANRYNRFNPYRRPFERTNGINVDYIKDTMEFYNCVIFIQETDPDMTTHREFADNEWHFYAIGNIGDSKKTDNTRLTVLDDPKECCIEIMDVGLPLSAFPRDTMINAMSYKTDEETGEAIYTWAKDENIGILHEKQEDGTYVLTSDTAVDLTKTYYVDILEHDDFSEDYTYGWRYIADDEDEEIVNTCKQNWIDFYRFVTTSSDAEFKANLKNYFVIDSALYYYLFTTRYCMVDNRAKNTFWHYSKAKDGSYKWDLCWDYDNDTSLGLDNYGKQVYRYGLEDIDKDAAGKEVFRQSDSLFFCRIRDLFSSELKEMYQELESRDAWNADSLIKEYDEWQNQFPEELWRLDIERKYIRTFNSSFINGKGDKQFLTNMANGRMKYHRRLWERNQEQYMASKYQTNKALSEAYHANFRVNRFDSTADLAVLPDYQFTLTPFSYIYLNVQYGGTSPISVRAVPNVPTVVPYNGTSADIINVGSAAAIRDFGDLSALYPDTVSVQNASRVKVLKIGNDKDGYDNASFTSLTTGDNGLLEELDITNISSFDETLILDNLLNLKKLRASGTNVPGVLFADGGKLEYAELPAVNNITLKNLNYLTRAGLKLDSYENVVELNVEGCNLIDQLSLLEACYNATKVRLDNINFGTQTYEYFETKIFKLKGFDDKPNAQLTGTVHFVELDGEQFNNIKNRYPNLVITYGTLTSIIEFKDTDLATEFYKETVINAGDCKDPIDELGKEPPVHEETDEFVYEWFGWAETPDTLVNYENTAEEDLAAEEEANYQKYRVECIKHVEGNRTLYPVFRVTRKSYEVTFINPTDDNKVLQVLTVPYGSSAIYTAATPTKKDAASSSLYSFTGWYPSPEKIVGTLTCYAQFAILDSTWYTIGVNDISNCVDYKGNIFNGYELNSVDRTASITSCKNKYNVAVKIPENLTFASGAYTITGFGGFRDHTQMELIVLPDTVTSILSEALYNCSKLYEIILPDSLTTIGKNALQGCARLTTIHIPANVVSISSGAFANCPGLQSITVDSNNQKYAVLEGCLVDTSTNTLIQGLSSGLIPQDGSVKALSDFCFAGTSIVSILIPDGVTTIPSNAFSRCASLTNVSLPESITLLGATCFAWCSNLSNAPLPQGLKELKTYVFDSCALTDVKIPSSVDKIGECAFGHMSSLKTVTFGKELDENGEIKVPNIHEKAFSSSGSTGAKLVFNVPWSSDKTPNAPWGAVNATVNFDYEGE